MSLVLIETSPALGGCAAGAVPAPQPPLRAAVPIGLKKVHSCLLTLKETSNTVKGNSIPLLQEGDFTYPSISFRSVLSMDLSSPETAFQKFETVREIVKALERSEFGPVSANSSRTVMPRICSYFRMVFFAVH